MAASAWGVDHGTVSKAMPGMTKEQEYSSARLNAATGATVGAMAGGAALINRKRKFTRNALLGAAGAGVAASVYNNRKADRLGREIVAERAKVKKMAPDGADLHVPGCIKGKGGKKLRLKKVTGS